MNKETILAKLRELKPEYERGGFIIKGIFGSVARDEADENGDIDILYDLNPRFRELYMGFYAIGRIKGIKEELRQVFGCDVDLATTNNHSITLKEAISKEAVYV